MKLQYEPLELELIPMDSADIVTLSENEGGWDSGWNIFT